MIVFACQKCGKQFQLKPEFAGRKTTCSGCKEAIEVPTPDSPETISPPAKAKIAFSCTKCGMKFSVMPEFAGRATKCPTCKEALVVPSPDATIAYMPTAGKLDGTPSSLAHAEVDGGVTLGGGAAAGISSLNELPGGKAGDGARYVIESELARGGMGAVLRAIDCDIRREVAVKYLLDQTDAWNKIRFVEEAQITGQLEHPNIVPIHEIGIDSKKRIFFTMKMVKGRSVAEILEQLRDEPGRAEKAYPLSRLLSIFLNVCNGLAYAHARGVVHRDLKPANIMVGDFGEVYVMDWGLAKVLDKFTSMDTNPPMAMAVAGMAVAQTNRQIPVASPVETPVRAPYSTGAGKVVTSRELDADLTQAGTVMGTPVYMPPEQAAGHIHEIDERSDIYSMGAILYEMLTLKPPIDQTGGFWPIVTRVGQGQIELPEKKAPERALAGKIPVELAAVAMKALAKNKADRYQNIDLLRRDIELFVEGRSVSAKQDTIREVAVKFVKRNKAVSIATATAAAILAVVGLWSMIAILGANAQMRAEKAEKEARTREAVPALLDAARMSVERRNYQNARKQVELALLYAADHPEGTLLKAQILAIDGEYKNAAAEADRYLQMKPGDVKATQLRDHCAVTDPEEIANIITLSQLFEQQELQPFASSLLLRHAESIEARKQLLKPYQKKIDAAWPGLGKKLTMDMSGLLSLNLGSNGKIVSLGPLAGIPLSSLTLYNFQQVQDLSPLRGMPLQKLEIAYTGVRDLSALKGMRLNFLSCYGTVNIDDLSPLRGMPLTHLDLTGCKQVRDLSDLSGMPLTRLFLSSTGVIDLSPLRGMALTEVNLEFTRVHDLTPLRGMPLTELTLRSTGVQDLTPLQGMKIASLNVMRTQIRDLTPLKGMQFTTLDLTGCAQVQNLTPLKDMPLKSLNLSSTGVYDLSPLKDMPLTSLTLDRCGALKDLSPLEKLKLTNLSLDGSGQVKDLTPLKDMRLSVLCVRGTKVQDLSPLEGMQLSNIVLTPQNITKGFDVLRKMKSLTNIGTQLKSVGTPAEFWEKLDTGKFK